MKAKIPLWLWWLAVIIALVLAVREVAWLGDRLAAHRAQRHASVMSKAAAGSDVPADDRTRPFPVPISGFGPL